MPRKQKNMNGGEGGWFRDLFGVKTADQISQPDERVKRLKELEAKSSKDLASMVVDLEAQVKKLEDKIKSLENPAAAATAATDTEVPVKENEVRPPVPLTGGRRQRRKTRKSSA